MKKKIKITVFLMTCIAIILSGFIVYNKTKKQDIKVNGGAENGGLTYKADGSIELGEGFVSYGFYSTDGKLVEHDDLYSLTNGIFNGTYKFNQNREESNYMLIVLVDYLQYPFQADEKIDDKYLFTLTGSSGASIDVEIDLRKQDAREITFLIVEEPYHMNLTNNNILASRSIYTTRVQLTQDKTDIEFDDTYHEMQPLSHPMFELSKSHKDVRMTPECISGETIELMMGGSENEDMEYAVAAFSNWEQVPLWNNEMVQFVKIPAGKNIYYEIPLPEVEEDTPYQIIEFEWPFTKQEFGTFGKATLRTIIKKEE